MYDILPEIVFFLLASGVGGAAVTPMIASKIKAQNLLEENESLVKLGYTDVKGYEQINEIIDDLNTLYQFPNSVVRPKYSLEYYTLLYEIKNKVKLNIGEYISPIDLSKININQLTKLNKEDRLYSMSREIAVTKELDKDEMLNKIKELGEMKEMRNMIVQNHFLETYMNKTRENRLKFADNTEEVLIGSKDLKYLIEEQERKFSKVNSEVEEMLNRKII